MMKGKKRIIKSMLLACVFMFMRTDFAFAETKISMGISPSRIFDEQLNYEESKTFEINVANTSKNVTSGGSITIEVSSSLEDEYGEIIDGEEIINIDKKTIVLEPNTLEKVQVNIKAPKEIVSGNYVAYVNFTQTNVEGFSLGNQVNELSVPIYIFIGSEEEYKNRVIGYDLTNSYISSNGNNTTISKELLKNSIKLLNPLNIISVYKNIINEPLYNFENKKGNKLDFNDSYYTKMKKVSTTSEKKLNDNTYILYKKEDLNKKIIKTVSNVNELQIYLEDNTIIKIPLNKDMIKNAEDQLINISKTNKDYTLEMLMDVLMLPKNKTYSIPKIFLTSEIENKGTIPLVIRGEYELIFNNIEIVSKGKINSPTLLPNKTIKFDTEISNILLEEGNYDLSVKVSSKNIDKDINLSFSHSHLRTVLLAMVSIFLVLYYTSIGILSNYIFKKIKFKIKLKNK